jgi:predicted dehydrogenase
MRRLRLAIIGTGVAARILHWPALKELANYYEIVAVANRSRDKGEAFAEMVGLDRSAVYDDYRELLARDDVEVVDLVLPPQLNYEVARAAAQVGVHVICEKPIAPTVEEARAIAALPEAFGVQVLVAENFRYDNAVRCARALMDEGAVGAPFMLSYQWMQPVPPDDEIAGRPWRKEPSLAGGLLSDHGVHMIDVCRYLMGEIIAVHLFALDLRDHLGGLDTAVYNLKFESGAVGSIQWSFGVASDQRSCLQLWSDDGSVEVKPGEVRLLRKGRPDEAFSIAGPTSFRNEFEDFYAALVGGKPPLMTVWDAVRDLEAISAGYESALTNKVMYLGTLERSANGQEGQS